MKRKKNSHESFFWKWESRFDKGAGIFFTKPRDISVQGPKKIRRITLKKNVSRIFFWTCKFLFLTTAPKFFRQGIDQKPFVVQKEWKCVCFEKHCFSLKCSYGHVECSSNKPAKKREAAKNFCSVSENDKKFICFQNSFFSKKDSIDTENAVLTSPPNFYCSNTRNDPKKVNKMQKLFKAFFFELFSWRGRKQLESPADFFFENQVNFFRSILKKRTNCNFSERFSPETRKFPLKMRTQFWWRRRDFPYKIPRTFRSRSEKD